jgi:ferredoxin
MADKNRKNPAGVAGPYFVDDTCISCEACVEEAEENFALDDGAKAFVCKQPADAGEREACESALDACPVQAIGKEGD